VIGSTPAGVQKRRLLMIDDTIALVCLSRTKALLASFEQTPQRRSSPGGDARTGTAAETPYTPLSDALTLATCVSTPEDKLTTPTQARSGRTTGTSY
jgi:hypothetical protein